MIDFKIIKNTLYDYLSAITSNVYHNQLPKNFDFANNIGVVFYLDDINDKSYIKITNFEVRLVTEQKNKIDAMNKALLIIEELTNKFDGLIRIRQAVGFKTMTSLIDDDDKQNIILQFEIIYD